MAEPYPRTVLTEFRILLDDATVIRLLAIADDAHMPPEIIIQSMVKAIVDDDFCAHYGTPPPAGVTFH
jgi:hypothetical protein